MIPPLLPGPGVARAAGLELPEERCLLVAEAASNHRGDLERARALLWAARDAGADVVKFQSWQSRNLRPDDPDLEYFRGRELTDAGHAALIEECRKAGIAFLTTCFDRGRIPFLRSLGIRWVKVPSPDAGSRAMLRDLAGAFDALVVSTGMTPRIEIEKTASVLRHEGKPFALLHCVSLYPTPPEKANLRRMEWLREFAREVGFSDHTAGTGAARVAAAMGARIVEKHFDLERSPEKPFEADPSGLREIAEAFREIAALRGAGDPEMQPEEDPMRRKFVDRWGVNR